MKSEPGSPMTLGNAAAARVRLIVWCKDCQHQVEPDPAEMGQRYGVETPVTRLARAADLLPMRQPSNRYGGYWRGSRAIAPGARIVETIAPNARMC